MKLIGRVGEARGERRVLGYAKLDLFVLETRFLSRDFLDFRSFRAEFSGDGVVMKLLLTAIALGIGSLALNGDRLVWMGDTDILGFGLLTAVRFLLASIGNTSFLIIF